MKVTDTQHISQVLPAEKAGVTERVRSPAVRDGLPDEIELSNEVRELRAREAARIAALREQISSGNYEIDLAKLARVIADQELL